MSDNPNFVAKYSTDVIYVGEDMTLCLTDELSNKADVDHVHFDYASTSDLEALEETVDNKMDVNHFYDEFDTFREEVREEIRNELDGELEGVYGQLDEYTLRMDDIVSELENKADIDHTHEDYALSSDLTELEDVISTKSDSTHTHEEYADVNHVHTDYATQVALDTLGEVVNGKANAAHSHEEYANVSHEHENYVTTTSFNTLNEKVGGKADATHTHTEYALTSHNHDSSYAPLSHSHNDYVTTTDFENLETVVSGKANEVHSHTEYALSTHEHTNYSEVGHTHNYSETTHNHDDIYVSQTNFDALENAVSGKSNASHTHDDRYFTETEINSKLANKADSTHTHTGVYDVNGAAANALTSANTYTDNAVETLNETIATKANASDLTSHIGNTTMHITNVERNKWNAKSDFSGSYNDLTDKPSIPSISGLATETYVDEAVSSKADNSHNHNSVYYTQTQIDTFLSNKSNSTHNHDSSYDALGTAETKANEVQANLDVVSEELSEHVGNSTIHFTEDERTKLSGIAEGANKYTLPSAGTSLGGVKSGGDVTITNGVITVNDDSHNHTIVNVDGLQSALDSKASSGHTHSDVYTETEVDILLEGKANTSHTHSISSVTNLQSILDGKASSNHGTHVSYSTTTPTMDGSASVGTASTVARSDHKHPTDTSRAAQTDLDAHTGNTTVHTNATERNNLNTAYTHSQSSHAPSNAEKNQNAFSYVKVGSTSVAADTATDTLTLVAGNNVTITPDATGDSITISSTDTNTTYSAGTGISLSGTTFSNSGVRSISTGTANGTISVNTNGTSTDVAVKGLGSAAYTASTAYDVAGAADTALETAKEYTDTVASGKANSSHTHTISNITNLQTTLDGKASSSHTHKVANITDLTATATELNYMDGVTSNVQTQLDGKASSGHTHLTATTSTAGLMSAEDKAKLNGIASGANAYTLPTASSSTLGGVKTTSTVTSNSGYTACPIISGVPYYKDTNTTYNLGSFGVTATSTELNVLDGVTATTTEINYVDGVTSNIQTQLNGKASSSHTHNYAGSSSAGGAATSANKLNTNAGSTTQPVYFANGVPVATTYTLGKSVPSDAKFTDTTYGVATTSTNGLMSLSDKTKLDSMELATVSEVETYLGI